MWGIKQEEQFSFTDLLRARGNNLNLYTLIVSQFTNCNFSTDTQVRGISQKYNTYLHAHGLCLIFSIEGTGKSSFLT